MRIRSIILLCLIYCTTTSKVCASHFQFDYHQKSLTISGEIKKDFLSTLHRFLKKEYYKLLRKKIYKGPFFEYSVAEINNEIKNDLVFNKLLRNDAFLAFKFFHKLQIKKIEINSVGGNLFQGYTLARLVSLMSLEIFVPKNSVCNSTCAFIFHHAAIHKRSIHPTSTLMYHLSTIKFFRPFKETITCHTFNIDECNPSVELIELNNKYTMFLYELPYDIFLEVISGKDSIVNYEYAQALNIIQLTP